MAGIRHCMLLFFVVVVTSCHTTHKSTHNSSTGNLVTNGKLWSSLFQQKAAEYHALCHQAYNIAAIRIDEALKIPADKPLAIITDIDETVLDNSPYAVHRGLQGQDYSNASWYEWTAKAAATPLPGSLDFFKHTAEKGVTIFYITNRDETERPATLANLRKFNYPFADDEHLILRQTVSSKESRRQAVSATYEIILLIGDNLSDFSTLWDKKNTEEREKNVTANATLFGKKFIMLPNTNYGGWEDALYGNQHTLTTMQKDSAIKTNLHSY